jgi:hypothetical protein
MRRLLAALALAVPLRVAPWIAVLAAPAAAWAQGDAYKQHMDNGVKLFHDQNYPAAITEFRAAYEARPNPNPLVNIALCEKAVFRYPQAIAALDEALEKHGAAMDPADKKAAEEAITEMRGLLGTVAVTVAPQHATVLVDGEELRPGAADKPIALGPGAHKIEARAEGFAPGEQSVTVTSGQAAQLTLTLVADKAWVTVQAADPQMTIAIDQRAVGLGSWAGMLPPGPHLVQTYGPSGQPQATPIVAIAGRPLTIRPGPGGTLVVGGGEAPVPPPPPPPKKEEPPVPRGFYLLALGSALIPLTHPDYFVSPKNAYGAAYGLRLGFQVNRIAGFDLSYEHSSISDTSTIDYYTSYRILSDRFAVGMRLISPGRLVRFVGSLAGGIVIDGMEYDPSPAPKPGTRAICYPLVNGKCPLKDNPVGADAFGLAEVAAEFDLDHVLIDLGFEAQFESTGNLQTTPTKDSKTGVTPQAIGIFGAKPIANIGPALRVGYRFW